MTKRDLIINTIYQALIKDDEGENEGELLRISEGGGLEMTLGSSTFTARFYKGEVMTVAFNRPENMDFSEDEILDIASIYKEAIDKTIQHLKAMDSNGGSYAYH